MTSYSRESLERIIKRVVSGGNFSQEKIREAIEAENAETTQVVKVKDIPAREKWLYENPEALAIVEEGLKDSAEGRTHDMPSFAQYVLGDLDLDSDSYIKPAKGMHCWRTGGDTDCGATEKVPHCRLCGDVTDPYSQRSRQ